MDDTLQLDIRSQRFQQLGIGLDLLPGILVHGQKAVVQRFHIPFVPVQCAPGNFPLLVYGRIIQQLAENQISDGDAAFRYGQNHFADARMAAVDIDPPQRRTLFHRRGVTGFAAGMALGGGIDALAEGIL